MRARWSRRWPLIGLILAMALAACGEGADEAAPPEDAGAGDATGTAAGETEVGEGDVAAADCTAVTARASHHISGQSAAHFGLETLGEEAAAATDGRFTLEVLSDAQLGGLAEMTENLRSGAVEIALIDSGSLSQFLPEIGAFDLPFLFDEMGEFDTLMDGPVGETVDELIVADIGVVPLYWSAVGLRDMFFVDAEVRTVDDMQGLTMRVPEAPVWVDTFSALGTSPTAIPAGELYTALETGVVDGFEFPLGTAVDLKMYEPVTTQTKTGHILTNILIAASPTFVDGLCEQDRDALFAAVEVARERTRTLWAEDNAAAEEVLDENLTVVSDPDLESFRDTVAPVHDAFVEEHGAELYDMITDQLGG